MPRISIDDVAGLQPGGVPRGTVAVPDVPSPTAPDSLALASPRALSGFGGTLSQAGGDVLERMRTAGNAAQRSQDILDSDQQAQEFELAMQAEFASMVDTGDFRTIPDDVVARGRTLAQQMRQGLNQSAGQRFETKATDFLATLQAKALGVRTARREEQKAFVAEQGVELHTRGIAEAADMAEAEYHRLELLDMFQEGVKTGLWRGDEAAKMYQKALDDADVLRWQTQIQLDPEGAEAALRERAARGEQMIGDQPIAALIDSASAESREAWRESEERESAARLDIERAQQSNESRLANRIDTAKSLGQLQGIERVVRRMGEDPSGEGLTIQSFNRLRSAISARKKALTTGADVVSDPGVLRNLQFAVFSNRGMRNRTETIELRSNLYRSIDAGLLQFDDPRVAKLMGELENELDGSYYTKADGYSQADTDLDSNLRTSAFDEFDARGETLRVVAKREFQDRVYEVWEQGGNREVTKRIREIQRDVENNYAEQTLQAVRNALRIPPRELPHGILDESGLSDKTPISELQARFDAARQKLAQMHRDGAVRDPYQLERWIVILDQRARWWGLLTGTLTNLPFRARGTGGAGGGTFQQGR